VCSSTRSTCDPVSTPNLKLDPYINNNTVFMNVWNMYFINPFVMLRLLSACSYVVVLSSGLLLAIVGTYFSEMISVTT